MGRIIIFCQPVWLFIFLVAQPSFGEEQVFSFHLFEEPADLDPLSGSSSSGSYLLHNLHRGLYRWTQKGLVLEGAESCQRKNLKVTCKLSSKHRWQNGERIVAQDYVRRFHQLFKNKSNPSLLSSMMVLKNADLALKDSSQLQSLGVRAKDNETLEFELKEADADFFFRLIHPGLSPLDASLKHQASGPYQLRRWARGQSIDLEMNPYYPTHGEPRPPVKIYFISDDYAALRLYESGRMSFLRRLPRAQLKRYLNKPELHKVSQARFDYIGFANQLQGETFRTLRRALSKSLKYEELQKIYDSDGRPGCPSLPADLQSEVICHHFENPSGLKASLKQLSSLPDLQLGFSQMGGEDIQKGMEWAAAQWQKNLGLKIRLAGTEQRLYLSQLRQSKHSLFRKGVGLDRPTCLAALEIFSKDHPENYSRWQSQPFEELLISLRTSEDIVMNKKLCSQGLSLLMNDFALIPQGEIYFVLLAAPSFKGWELNSMNQLDLSQLTVSK